MRTRLFLLMALAAPVLPAAAQNVIFDAPGLLEKKGKPGLPDVKASPEAWPRLTRRGAAGNCISRTARRVISTI